MIAEATSIRRILAVSDLHMRPARLAWVIDEATRHDLVVIAGDTLDAGIGLPADRARDEIVSFVGALRRRSAVAICSGNHDLTDQDPRGERAALWVPMARSAGAWTDGDLLITDELAVSVCGWSDGRRGRRLEAARLRDQRRLVGRRRWIVVRHAPPATSRTAWDGRRDCGDHDFARLVTEFRPDVVVSGHAHEAPFARDGDWQDRLASTLIVNPGQVPGSRPACVKIDCRLDTVTWNSSIGDAQIEESVPFERTTVDHAAADRRALQSASQSC